MWLRFHHVPMRHKLTYAQQKIQVRRSKAVKHDSVCGRDVRDYFNGAVNGYSITACSTKIMNQKPENQEKSTGNESGEDRLARQGFFLNDDLRGSKEGEQLAGQLADLFKSMQKGPPFDPANAYSEPPSTLSSIQKQHLEILQPMSENHATIICKQNRPIFTDDQMDLIRLGLIPNDMNSEWVMVYVERSRRLRIHRVATGLCLYEVCFNLGRSGWEVGKIKFSCSESAKDSVEGNSADIAPMTLINRYFLSA